MPSDNVSREAAKRAMLKVDAGQFDAPTVDQFIAALDALPAAEDGRATELRRWLVEKMDASLQDPVLLKSLPTMRWVLQYLDSIPSSPAAPKSEKPEPTGIFHARIRLRPDRSRSPHFDYGDATRLIEVDGLYYDVNWIKSVVGLRRDQLMVTDESGRNLEPVEVDF